MRKSDIFPTMKSLLSTSDHDRDIAGLKYVYPVISRRAGGLSIGVNFNTNNACNWRCIYCQVPDLKRGAAPELDLPLLQDQLKYFLHDVLHGDFYQRFQVDAGNRVIKDIAISGNGEPTSSKQFAQAVALIGETATEAGVFPASRFVLISNGSLMHHRKVQDGLRNLAYYSGEVWFKFDSATREGRQLFNNTLQPLKGSLQNIGIASELCVTKLQTCVFDLAGQGLSEREKNAYLDALVKIKATSRVSEVMFYTIARPSMQPEAGQLAVLPSEVLHSLAEEIRAIGFKVSVSC